MTLPCSIIVDCRLQIHYASYYIVGFDRLNLPYSYGIIEDLPLRDKCQLMRGLAFTVQSKSSGITKIFIDTYDLDNIDKDFYDWADVYAKVNLKKSDTNLDKVIPAGPNFGVRIGGAAYTLGLGIRNYFHSRSKYPSTVKPSFREFIHGYLYSLYRRSTIDVYENEYKEDEDYIFTMNTLWYDKNTDTTTNTLRGYFALYCKRVMKSFEGGFFYINQRVVVEQFPEYTKYLEKYKDIITQKRVSLKQYIQKTKKSAFVFSTPSVGGCHGWKFGEYIAMGKAIISTTMNHEMPGSFVAGEHYLLANSEDEIAETVRLLLGDKNKRNDLKINAKRYYKEVIAPEAVVSHILSVADNLVK